MPPEREQLEADVLIIGAGPAGLAFALPPPEFNRATHPGQQISCALRRKYLRAGKSPRSWRPPALRRDHGRARPPRTRPRLRKIRPPRHARHRRRRLLLLRK